MTTLRSGTVVSFENGRSARRHPPPAAPNPHAARHARDLQQARAYQRATGDSPATLRQKRRWLNNEHEAGRISGKACRELMDFYSKKKIGKPKSRLPKVRGLTSDARSVKRRLDEWFIARLDETPSTITMNENHRNTFGDAGEGPSGAANHLEDPHHNGHRALGQSTDGRVLDEPPNGGAADTLPGAYIKPEDTTETEDDMETEDESSTEEEDLVSHAEQTTKLPANTAEANDTAARQRILELGLQLADHSGGGLDTDMRVGYIEEVKIKREEEGNE